jgi:hypothetical protein
VVAMKLPTPGGGEPTSVGLVTNVATVGYWKSSNPSGYPRPGHVPDGAASAEAMNESRPRHCIRDVARTGTRGEALITIQNFPVVYYKSSTYVAIWRIFNESRPYFQQRFTKNVLRLRAGGAARTIRPDRGAPEASLKGPPMSAPETSIAGATVPAVSDARRRAPADRDHTRPRTQHRHRRPRLRASGAVRHRIRARAAVRMRMPRTGRAGRARVCVRAVRARTARRHAVVTHAAQKLTQPDASERAT